jgi:hemerythrin-like domain-containing protein
MVLRQEHERILRALAALDAAAARLAAGGAVPDGWWQEMVDWLRDFADRSHHAKEERGLFPAMARAGVPPEHGPIAVMLEEHAEGRALVQEVRGAADGPARARAAARYVALLRAHIDKENEVLFPLADAVLDERGQQSVARDFDALEAELGPGYGAEAAAARLDRLWPGGR